MIRRSPSLHGVPRVGSPASSVHRERSDFPRPSRLASPLGRSAVPPQHLSFRSHVGQVPASVGRGLVRRLAGRLVVGGDYGISQVPGRTLARAPRSSTPEESPRQAVAARRCCRHSVPGERRLPRCGLFRGSIPRLVRSLSTLRSVDRSIATQDSLHGWWPAFAGWVFHPLGSFTRGFTMATSSVLLSQA